MPQIINTNVSSLNSQRQLNRSQVGLQNAMERLSSGLRINSAKDDAAGLAISDRMSAQIRGLNQAVRNANDGISVAQTAEGALQESTNILQRMRELSVQSANDTNSSTDRSNLQKEVSQLQQELNRIADTTRFNGKSLLDGTFTAQKFQVGAFSGETINVTIGNSRSTHMGNNTVTTNGTASTAIAANAAMPAANTVVAAEDLTITGSIGTAPITVNAGDTAKAVADATNAVTSSTGVTASAITQATLSSVATGTMSFNLYGSNSTAVAVSANVTSTSDLTTLSDAINAVSSSTGLVATLSSNRASLTLTSSQGYDIGIENYLNGVATMSVQGLNADGTVSGGAQTLTSAGTDSTRVGGDVAFKSASAFSVTSGSAGGLFTATTANASALSSVSSVNIGTQTGSNNAIDIIDGALAFIADNRANLGAVQNRFSSTISNLENVSQNVSAARSRIQDADFAQESANLARSQILQQAGTAMLAQANASTQSVMQLLQG
jgi:flagellin